MENKKVLIISTVGLKLNGISSVIYNYLYNMNADLLHIAFIAFDDTSPEIQKKFEKIGRVLIVPDRKKSIGKYVAALYAVLADHYDIVHIHGNSGTMLLEVLLARMKRVKKVIVHSHNTTCSHQIINCLMKFPMKLLATDLLACSAAAGKWLYGNSSYTVLNNAIDIKRFQYDPDLRQECRKKLEMTDEIVVGHIGHFTEQKNHDFLIDIFSEFHRIRPHSKLLLASDGPRLEQIREKVSLSGLGDSVIFAGRRDDMEELYCAMDIFVLPSLWEGLPVVMLEAQASALPLLVSDNITRAAKCTDRTYYKSLGDGAQSWAEKISEICDAHYDRKIEVSKFIKKQEFDITHEAEKLRMIYLKN